FGDERASHVRAGARAQSQERHRNNPGGHQGAEQRELHPKPQSLPHGRGTGMGILSSRLVVRPGSMRTAVTIGRIRSCHATNRYSPGGTPSMANRPDESGVTKY